ncbi:hypothetical protein [Sorangium sp. So ce204]|uniref:hypothetical protein n=1 Tax=Sorangium sp. So ce204 TaxID=3133288 RepID=UPI003F5D6963
MPAVQNETVSPDDAEAGEVVQVMRAYYGLAQTINKADFKAAGCNDKTVGFAALLDCNQNSLREIIAVKSQVPSEGAAKAACGREVEAAHRKFIDGQVKYHQAMVSWLEANRLRLTPALVNKALGAACSSSAALCKGRPYDFAYEAEWYGIGKIECAKRLFQCGPSDNVCSINKVASRLEVGPEPYHSDGLFVRSTGKRIR